MRGLNDLVLAYVIPALIAALCLISMVILALVFEGSLHSIGYVGTVMK